MVGLIYGPAGTCLEYGAGVTKVLRDGSLCEALAFKVRTPRVRKHALHQPERRSAHIHVPANASLLGGLCDRHIRVAVDAKNGFTGTKGSAKARHHGARTIKRLCQLSLAVSTLRTAAQPLCALQVVRHHGRMRSA